MPSITKERLAMQRCYGMDNHCFDSGEEGIDASCIKPTGMAKQQTCVMNDKKKKNSTKQFHNLIIKYLNL